MERISDSELQLEIQYNSPEENRERRAADKPLDIKGQLRLVRDRCPELWKMVRSDIADCPEGFQLSSGECLAKNCKECWDKALEGDE